MNELAVLVQMAVILAAMVIPIVVIVRYMDGEDTLALRGTFPESNRPAWPHGIQEEEPQPRRFAAAAD